MIRELKDLYEIDVQLDENVVTSLLDMDSRPYNADDNHLSFSQFNTPDATLPPIRSELPTPRDEISPFNQDDNRLVVSPSNQSQQHESEQNTPLESPTDRDHSLQLNTTPERPDSTLTQGRGEGSTIQKVPSQFFNTASSANTSDPPSTHHSTSSGSTAAFNPFEGASVDQQSSDAFVPAAGVPGRGNKRRQLTLGGEKDKGSRITVAPVLDGTMPSPAEMMGLPTTTLKNHFSAWAKSSLTLCSLSPDKMRQLFKRYNSTYPLHKYAEDQECNVITLNSSVQFTVAIESALPFPQSLITVPLKRIILHSLT